MAHRTYPNIAAYLSDTGMNQAELAAKLGRSQAFISKVVNGLTQPSLQEALRIARVCHVPVESLAIRNEYITEGK